MQLDLFAPPPPAPRTTWLEPATDAHGQAIETIGYGSANDRHGMKPHYFIDLQKDTATGLWASRIDYGYGDGGGGGPFREATYPTRDDALIDALRRCIQSCARAIANTPHGETAKAKMWTKIVHWACASSPKAVMFGGPDLVAEFNEALDIYRASAERRRAAWQAVHDLKDKADSAMREAGLFGYSGSQDAGLIRNPDASDSSGAGSDPEGHARQWPGHWYITGHAPDALSIEVEPRTGQADSPTIARALQQLREVTGVDVALIDETAPAPYSRHGNWTWGNRASPYGQEAGL